MPSSLASFLVAHDPHLLSFRPSAVSQVGVIYDIPLKELRMFTDYGRASRPLFIVDNQSLLIRKTDIIKLQVDDQVLDRYIQVMKL